VLSGLGRGAPFCPRSQDPKAPHLSHWQVSTPRLPRLTRGVGPSGPKPVSNHHEHTPRRACRGSGFVIFADGCFSPEEVLQAIGRLRKEARDEIDRLIGFLDKTDNYVSRELEDAVDDVACDDVGEAEPSLGWTDQEARRGKHAWSGDIDAELDRCDDEPALGSTNTDFNQARWTEGNRDDREGDGCADDREGDELEHGGDGARENDEPSFGWSDEEAARGSYPSLMGARVEFEGE
jgi:hypothetical protein